MRIPPEHCGRSDSADAERPALSESGRAGVLAASERQVLTKLKLEGLSAKELAQLEGSTSEEAVRHIPQFLDLQPRFAVRSGDNPLL